MGTMIPLLVNCLYKIFVCWWVHFIVMDYFDWFSLDISHPSTDVMVLR